MRNQRTQELADRLNTGWQQWKTIELSDSLESFLDDMKANTNGRMIEWSPFDRGDYNPYFMLQGEGKIYHFDYNSSTDTWSCKA